MFDDILVVSSWNVDSFRTLVWDSCLARLIVFENHSKSLILQHCFYSLFGLFSMFLEVEIEMKM